MAHTFGSNSTRTSSAGNPITTASFTVDKLDTVIVLLLKVNGGTNRAGGDPSFAGQTMTQANSTQKAAASPEASCELWYLLNPPKGAFTCTIPNTGALTIFYTLATGRAKPGGRSYLDGANGGNGTSTNPTPGAIVTTTDGDIGFAVFASGITDASVATGAGTALQAYGFDDGAHGGGQQYHLQSTLGATTLSFTLGSDDWGCVAAYFKESLPPVFNNHLSVDADSGISVTEKIR